MRRSKREMMELYRQICDLRRQGKKRAQISRESGCSISTVDRAIRMCGEQDIRQDRFEDHREKILAMYGDGATLKEMAEEKGLAPGRGAQEHEERHDAPGADGAGRGDAGNQAVCRPCQESADGQGKSRE